MTDHEQLIESLRDLSALDEGIAFVNSGGYWSFPRLDAGASEKHPALIEALAQLACQREIDRRDLALLVSNVNRSDGLTNVAIFRRSDKQILASQSAPTASLALVLALTEAIKATGADTIKATEPQHKRRWVWESGGISGRWLCQGFGARRPGDRCQGCGMVMPEHGKSWQIDCECEIADTIKATDGVVESLANATQAEKACTDATQAPPAPACAEPVEGACWQRLDDYVEKHSAKGSFNENIRDCLRDLRQQQMEQAATLAALVNDTPLTPAWVRTELDDLRAAFEAHLHPDKPPVDWPDIEGQICHALSGVERDADEDA